MDARIAREIQVDVLLGELSLDTELAGKTKGRHAVDEAEVDRLGATTLSVRHVGERRAEHFRSGGAVDIELVLESLEEPRIP